MKAEEYSYRTALYLTGTVKFPDAFEVIPGVVIREMDAESASKFPKQSGADNNPHLEANYLIDIYREQYLEALRLRIDKEGLKYLNEKRLDMEVQSILMQLA